MYNCDDALGYYNILNIDTNADSTLIKRSYYEKAKQLHPDHNASAASVDVFQKLSIAYETLSNPLKRVQYDLLSLVYKEKDFPQIGSLKIYKNQDNNEDNALRVLKQHKVYPGLGVTEVRESKDICNIHEAGNMVLNTSIHNWLLGWWGKGAFVKNIEAIKYNIRATSVNDKDNLQLLLHNAIAYAQEQNLAMAWTYAQQVKILWGGNPRISMLIERFISLLEYKPSQQIVIPYWNAAELRRRQLLFPIFLGLLATLLLFGFLYYQGIIGTATKKSYYYAGGIGADTLENKILKTDSNEYSLEYVAHLNKDANIYHGPDDRYAVMFAGKKNQSIRITGYTADKEWYQVVIDNGERGYVNKNNITMGMGNDVPVNSHVYKK